MNTSMKKAIVIGAGLGGLAAAIKLAHAGYRVTVLEQQATVGGKLQRVQRDGYLFDRGPSTITMRHIFESLFKSVGRSLEDYVTLYRLDSASRNLFHDGSIVDGTSDQEAMIEQLAAFSPRDAANYRSFMEESAALYRLAEEQFLNRLLAGWSDKLRPGLVGGFLKAKPFTSLNGLLRRYFSHPHTLAMFGRYATYVGSDPAKAPAIFGMLAHVELELGVYAAKGGNYEIAEAFSKLAKELGAEIVTSEKVLHIVVKRGKVTGVSTAKGDYGAELVVAGGDVLSVNRELIPANARPSMSNARIGGYEPSLSGFAMMAGVRRVYSGLRHHTVFYPSIYGGEFSDIFQRLTAPTDPAIYICHSGYSEAGMAPPGGSNLFILANAPYLSERWDWEKQREEYAAFLLTKLEERGLCGLVSSTEFAETYSPLDLQADTSAYRGAIYGISSNTPRQTFNRPSNKSNVEGLWFVGGTTHPGGGTPMVTLSGMLVADRILKNAASSS